MTTYDYQVISSIVQIFIDIHLMQRIPLLLLSYDNIVKDSAPDFSSRYLICIISEVNHPDAVQFKRCKSRGSWLRTI